MSDKRPYSASGDTQLAKRAAAQHGVVSRAQLYAGGYTRHAIGTRIRAGRLHRIHHGVYAVGHPNLTLNGRFMAAVLACGRDAVLSHWDAAVLHGLLRPGTGAIHVTAPTRHRLPGVRCHSCGDSVDVAEIAGIAVTSLERVLLDLAGRHQFAAALRQGQHEDKLDLRRLDDLIARCPGHRGVGALRAALDELSDEPGWTQSELERRFLALAKAHGLPAPLTNQYVMGELVDAYWPDHGLVVEIDGWRTHRTRESFEADRARDAKLAAAGYRVMRFTYRRLRDDPAGVAKDVADALRRG